MLNFAFRNLLLGSSAKLSTFVPRTVMPKTEDTGVNAPVNVGTTSAIAKVAMGRKFSIELDFRSSASNFKIGFGKDAAGNAFEYEALNSDHWHMPVTAPDGSSAYSPFLYEFIDFGFGVADPSKFKFVVDQDNKSFDIYINGNLSRTAVHGSTLTESFLNLAVTYGDAINNVVYQNLDAAGSGTPTLSLNSVVYSPIYRSALFDVNYTNKGNLTPNTFEVSLDSGNTWSPLIVSSNNTAGKATLALVNIDKSVAGSIPAKIRVKNNAAFIIDAPFMATANSGGGDTGTPPISGLYSPLANDLVVNTFGPTKTNTTVLFDAGAFAHGVKYVHSGQSENSVRILADSTGASTYVEVSLGNYYFTPAYFKDGVQIGSGNTHTVNKVAGDVLEVSYNVKTHRMVYVINGVTVYDYGIPQEIWGSFGGTQGRYMRFERSGYINAGNEPTITLSGGTTAPTLVTASDLGIGNFAFWDVDYVGHPYGYMYRVEDQAGNVVKDWEELHVSNNTLPGRCRLTASSFHDVKGIGFNYVMSEFTGNKVPVGVKFSMRRTILKKGSIGSNIAAMGIPYRQTRVYTNMLRQGQIRNYNSYGYYSAYRLSDRDSVSELGEPLVSGKLMYTCQGPDVGGTHVLEFTFQSGDMPVLDWQSLTGSGYFGATTYYPDEKRATVSYTLDANKLKNESLNGEIGMRIVSLNPANPPKGMFLCEQGEDKTKTFHAPYITRLSKLNGPMRHMDNVQANEPWRYRDNPNWSYRAKRNILGEQPHVIPLEDLVELSVACNRPIWLNISHGLMYTDAGFDYITRMLKLVFNGEGGELGYGVSRSLRHKIEMGNENWNSGLGNWSHLAYYAREAGRATFTDGNGQGMQAASIAERILQYNRAMVLVMQVLPDWADRFDRVFGLQMGEGDIFGNLANAAGFDTSLTMIDRFALAPYLPGDPNAGDGTSNQPASHSPEDVVIWLRSTLAEKIADVTNVIQKIMNRWSIPCDLYEWNIAFPAIYDRTKAEERAIKSSEVFYNFMKNEYIAAVVPIGGDSAIYSDDGLPAGGTDPNFSQSWYFYEAPYVGAGNKSWDALVDYAAENGYVNTGA